MKLGDVALVLGHAGPGRSVALAQLARSHGADAVAAAVARGMRSGSAASTRIAIGASSRIRAAAYLRLEGLELEAARLEAAERMGASEYAYFGTDDFEPYRALGAPLPAPLPGTRPDHDRPWALIEGISVEAARAELATVGLGDAQLHTLLPSGARLPGLAADVVRWLDWPSTVAAVLGRSYAVVAPDGPLLWDAERLERHALPVPDHDALARRMALAGTIPPVLMGDGRTLAALVDAAPAAFLSLLYDPDARRDGIERRLAEGPEEERSIDRARRRLRKLSEDPARFLTESRYGALRRAGGLVAKRWARGR